MPGKFFKHKLTPMLITAAAVGVYSAVKGIGVFNKPRFAKQHEAVGKYVETHFPGGTYSDITQTENGWFTAVTAADGSIHKLFLGRTPDGVFVFQEL